MADILRHRHFARPPVTNPNKRRRKGTIDLGKARRRRDENKCLRELPRPSFLDRPMCKGSWIDIRIDGDIGIIRLVRGLQSEGLMFTDGAIIDWPLDPEDVSLTDQIRQLINDLTPGELVEALEAIKAIKARRHGGKPAA